MAAQTHTRSHPPAPGVVARLPWWALVLPVLAFGALLTLMATRTRPEPIRRPVTSCGRSCGCWSADAFPFGGERVNTLRPLAHFMRSWGA
jgi:hypothetical protein